jgi:hypothetical protein
MKLFEIDNKHSLVHHVNEDIYDSYKMKVILEQIDEGFFRPWSRYLEEVTLKSGQPEEIFKQIQQQMSKTQGTANTGMMTKVVDRILPDTMIQRLDRSLPNPDPNARPDPNFEAKAMQSIQKLQISADAKQGLIKVVNSGKQNPAAQGIILSLLGGVLGGLLTKAAPFVAAAFPGGGTLAMGVIGALVAGTVAVAAGKIQGKGWKESFRGAIKPALSGATGAVLGSLARDFIGDAKSSQDDNTPQPAPTPEKPEEKPSEPQPKPQDKPTAGTGQTGGNVGQGIKYEPFRLEPETGTPPAAGEQPAATSTNDGDFVYDPRTGEMVPADSEIGRAVKAGQREPVKDSRQIPGKRLSEGQIYVSFRRIVARNEQLLSEGYLVVEGPMDLLKRAGSFLKGKSQNQTQLTTSDKLTAAWRAAQSPMDSDQLADFLRGQGINDKVIADVYGSMNIPLGGRPADQGQEPSAGAQSTATTASAGTVTPTDQITAQTTTPAEPAGPKPGMKLEMPGTNTEYTFTPQWLDSKGNSASEAVVKVLMQLASGTDKADINMADLKAARRSLGLMASKQHLGKAINEKAK